LRRGDQVQARGELGKAINAYLHGFETDWRDAYPGTNAITLMELNEPPDPRREKLIPVVAYAVERRISTSTPDYWDYATHLELAVLARDEMAAFEALANARRNPRTLGARNYRSQSTPNT
jgi:MAP3K TRAFs-binding domain